MSPSNLGVPHGTTPLYGTRSVQSELPPWQSHPQKEPFADPYAGRHPSLTCYHPQEVWPGPPGTGVTFDPRKSYKGSRAIVIACGRCIGCRLAKAQDWRTRLVHEAKLHRETSFVTLTYDDLSLPSDASVSREAVQLFLKRLRRRLNPDNDPAISGVRYFAVGEYGGQTFRPHYHLLVYGWFPLDARVWRRQHGADGFRSPLLEDLWPFGHSEIGHVSPRACGYIARYAMKKIGGDPALQHYVRPHPITGQFFRRLPEFALMSRRPGIGSGWYDRFHMDAFPSDYLVIDNKKVPVPRYYKNKLDFVSGLDLTSKRLVKARSPEVVVHKTPDRLAVREELAALRVKQLKRDLE